MTIQETAAAAKAEGLSYGQYVDAHKNDAPAESPPETTTRTCAHCGKEFPIGKRQTKKIYCCTQCRDAAAGPRTKSKPADQTARETILAKAEEIYQGNRAGQYGQRERNFETIAGLWSAYLGSEVTPCQVATMMALLKVARMRSGHYKEDNYVDAVNYLLFAAELEEAGT